MSNPPPRVQYTPSVTDGVLHHVSASQLKTFELCPRKWWFQKVAHTPDHSSTLARDLGTEIHAQLEAYLAGGPPPAHPSARAGLFHLPPPSPDILIEAPLLPAIHLAGVPWEGKIDVVVPPVPQTPTEAWVIDHKTTSNYRYILNPKSLSADTQMVSYAHWVALRYWGPSSLQRGTHRIKVSHVYYHTKPERLGVGEPLSRRVDAWVNTVDIPRQWAELTETVEEMKVAARAEDPAAVYGNRDSCRAYGGCPYQSRCQVEKPKNLTGLMQLGRGPAPAARPLNSAQEAQEIASRVGGHLRLPGLPTPTEVGVSDSLVPAAPAVAGLTLYVGCVPLVGLHAGVARPLEDVVSEYAAPILAEYRTPDLRMIPYAEGKGRLAAALRTTPPVGVYFVYRAHELTAVALEALMPLADTVIQGVG